MRNLRLIISLAFLAIALYHLAACAPRPRSASDCATFAAATVLDGCKGKYDRL